MMKKVFIALVLIVTFAAAHMVLAAPNIGIGSGGSGMAGEIAKQAGYSTAGVNDLTLSQSIGRVIRFALGLVGTIFLALTVYAGILWMTAQGNEEQTAKAKGIITMAMVGLIVVIAAYSLTAFILYAISYATTPAIVPVGGVR